MDTRTPLAEMGEFGLIERLTARFSAPADLHQGPGDDAAVWDLGGGQALVVSSDMLLEGIHFDLAYAPLKHVGYKAIAVNLSDIYAMNALPKGVLVNVGVSNRFPVEALEELYDGIQRACETYGVSLWGGDTSSSQQGLVLSVTAVGEAAEKNIVYRHGARPNDVLCVSGDLGAAFAGLQILEREKAVFKANPSVQPDLSGGAYVIGRQLKPEAHRWVVEMFARKGSRPTAMLDLSDGLASDLQHLARRSGVGVMVVQEKLPIHAETKLVAEQFNAPATSYALYGGEDYGLVFTVAPSQVELLSDNPDVHVIGYCTAQPGVGIVFSDGTVQPLEPMGFQHFKSEHPEGEG